MKVFKFWCNEYFYVFSGKTQDEANEELFEMFGAFDIDGIEEIPESQWDEKNIKCHEDNNFDLEPYFLSIRDNMTGELPAFICTNDFSTL